MGCFVSTRQTKVLDQSSLTLAREAGKSLKLKVVLDDEVDEHNLVTTVEAYTPFPC